METRYLPAFPALRDAKLGESFSAVIFILLLTEDLDGGNKWIVSPCSLDCICNAKLMDHSQGNVP
jgi:hypothetical protein